MLISFSGGRTSAFMTKFLLEYPKFKDIEKVVCFANTGKEFPKTLDFVNECDKRWKLNIVWLEAKVNPEKGKGTTFNIVDYESASRNGEPFENVIKKYGIPNKQFPHCTRELKQKPIKTYMQSLGYKNWTSAVGIRADEPNRLNKRPDSNFKNPYFPLAEEIQVDEIFIRNWWDSQEFDLQLKDYQSNCDLCWKKSKRKKLTLINEFDSIESWWNEMEILYGKGEYLFDQRDGLSMPDLVDMAKKPFAHAQDKHVKGSRIFDPTMDVEWGCMCKST